MPERTARLSEGYCPDETHGALDPRDGWCEVCAARWRLRDDGLVALMPVAEDMRTAIPVTLYRKLFHPMELDLNYLRPAQVAEITASYRGQVADEAEEP